MSEVGNLLTGEHAVGSWLDALDLLPGDSLPEHISTAIRTSTAFVMFWSREAAQSQWVRRELDIALAAPGPTVLLVRLDGAELPDAVRDLVWIDGVGVPPGVVADALATTMRRRRVRVRIDAARARGAEAMAAAARRKELARARDYPDDACASAAGRSGSRPGPVSSRAHRMLTEFAARRRATPTCVTRQTVRDVPISHRAISSPQQPSGADRPGDAADGG